MSRRQKQPLRDSRYYWQWNGGKWHAVSIDNVKLGRLPHQHLHGNEAVEHWDADHSVCIITKLRDEPFDSTTEPIDVMRSLLRLRRNG